MSKHIIVIGGGMAGTAAAYSLRSRGYKVTIIERNDRLGGRIRSESIEGAAVEMGAGFITSSYTNILTFLTETDLSKHLYRQRGSSGVLRGGKVKMATVSSLAGNDTLSWGAKLATIPLLLKTLLNWRKLDMHAPWQASQYDTQAVSETFQGKDGAELLDYVVSPVLNGYFYWSPKRTSLAMLLVIIKAMLKGGTQKLAGGLQQMPEKAAEGCEVLLNHDVLGVQKGVGGGFVITVKNKDRGLQLQADGIVCATTASVVSRIIPGLTSEQKNFFDSIGYSSTAVLAQAYPVNQTLGDKGLAFPRSEGSGLAAITVSPEKRDKGFKFATVKAYASGNFSEIQTLSDKSAEAQLLSERSAYDLAVLTRNAEPVATYFQKWPEALPIFEQGHFHKLRLFADGKIETPNAKMVFAGDYLGGPFMEGAFTSGLEAAKRLDAQLK